MRRVHQIFLIVGLLAITLVWGMLSVRVAHAACANAYTVQRGDWLANIARRHNMPLAELYRLNPWLWDQYHGNVIYPGQVLCLSVAQKRSAVALEINYKYQPDPDEAQFNLVARGGLLGKRQVYPVLTGDAMETFTAIEMTNALTQSIAAKRPPALVGIRNPAPNDTTYTLVTLNRPAIFESLRITGTLPVLAPDAECFLAAELNTPEAFQSTGVNDVALTLNLETSNGLRYPFTVTRVQALSNADLLNKCYILNSRQAGFALYPIKGNANLYSMQIVLEEGELGPPGRGWRRRCGGWGGYGGWFYRFIYAWYGC